MLVKACKIQGEHIIYSMFSAAQDEKNPKNLFHSSLLLRLGSKGYAQSSHSASGKEVWAELWAPDWMKGWGRDPSNLNSSKLHTVKNVLNCVPPLGINSTKSSLSGLDKHASVKPTAGSSGHINSDRSIIAQRMNQTPTLHLAVPTLAVIFFFVSDYLSMVAVLGLF